MCKAQKWKLVSLYPRKHLVLIVLFYCFFKISKKGSGNLPASKEKMNVVFFMNKDCYFFKSGGPYAMLATPKRSLESILNLKNKKIKKLALGFISLG